jgi:hypothetical protein
MQLQLLNLDYEGAQVTGSVFEEQRSNGSLAFEHNGKCRYPYLVMYQYLSAQLFNTIP